ncbi:sensor histidine kinase, partial [Anaerotignum faecicola]
SYTETLLDGAMEDAEIAQEFLGIINSEADRMAFLVRDLLQLTRFDNKQVRLDITKIEMNEFLSMTVRQNKIHAEAKHQTLTFEPYEHEVVVFGDRDRVGQVVNNIVTNAIKYSLEQASIRIFITEEEQFYKIHVKDTGMGITREDLPRIFERFYRVDKARSRAMGGTGLGLAIAKEIMESHGGKLTAESEYGKGTTMIMWFPKERPILEYEREEQKA